MKITGNKEKYCDRDSIPSEKYADGRLKGLELTRPALLEKTRRLLPMLRALEPGSWKAG